MASPVKNIDDLKAEIYKLKIKEGQQRYILGGRFNSPSATISTIKSLFSKSGTEGVEDNNGLKKDYLAVISSILLPLTLKRTVFKNSNFLVKSLVGLASKKAAGFINKESITGFWNKMRLLSSEKSGTVKSRPKPLR